MRVEGDNGDEERMVVVDLNEGILMAIVLDTVETYAKHRLGEKVHFVFLFCSGLRDLTHHFTFS